MRRSLLVLGGFGVLTASALSGACVNDSTPAPVFDLDAGSITIPPDLTPGTDGATPDSSVKADTGPVVGPGILDIAEKAFDFGDVDCGAKGTPKTFTVKNSGESAVSYTMTVEGSAFVVEGVTDGTIAPGATASFTLKTAAVPTFSSPGLPITGNLRVTTDIPGVPEVKLPITMTPQGAVLDVTPKTANFGQVKVGATSPALEVDVKNTGTRPATLTFPSKTSGDFALSWAGGGNDIVVNAGLTGVIQGSFAPKAVGSVASSIPFTVTGAVCQTVPTGVDVAGEGTYGVVNVSPGAIDFGSTDCGTTATSKKVTIQNDNAFAVAFTAKLPNGSMYVAAPASGSIVAGGSVDVTLTSAKMTAPRSVTPNAYGDTLTITTNAPNDGTPHVVPISQSARGAIFSASMATTNFGSHTLGQATPLPVALKNDGNIAASLTLAAAAPFSVSAPSVAVGANGGTAAPNAIYTPSGGGLVNGSVTFSAPGVPLCGALPSAIAVQGTGLVPKYVFGGKGLPTLNVTCGSGTASNTVQISNDVTATGDLIVSNVTAIGPITVSPTNPGPVKPGQSLTFTATANAPVLNVDVAGTTQAIGISFKTNDPGFPSVTFSSNRAVHGANLVWTAYNVATNGHDPITKLDYLGCPLQTPVSAFFELKNNGDLAGSVNLTATVGSYSFNFDGSNPLDIPANGGLSLQIFGSYNGAIGTTTSYVNVDPETLVVGGGQVCKTPGALPMRYVAVPQGTAPCN